MLEKEEARELAPGKHRVSHDTAELLGRNSEARKNRGQSREEDKGSTTLAMIS